MNHRRSFLACLLGMSAWATAATPPMAEPPVMGAVRDAARDWLAATDGIGLTIGIYDNGQRHFINVGSTELDGNQQPTRETVYEIGGLSKLFTGQLLARAVVEGRVALTDEPAKYLGEPYPNLANGGEVVRLLHLVNNTSQLIDNIPELTQVRGVPGEPLAVTRMRVIAKYTQKEFLWQLRRVMPKLPPGSAPAQTNVGAMLLGVVLQNVYGEPFEATLAREIEKPLRMKSGVAPPAKLLAKGYTRDNEPLPTFAAPMQYPAATLRYSADDLLRFASWQLVERDASVKLSHQPSWSTPDGRISMGFFWIIDGAPDSARGRRLLSTGATYGFASVCDLYPESKLAVVLLANKNAEGAQEGLRALSERIVGLLRPAADAGGVVSPRPSSAGAPPQGR
jgi:D-alanyl-D-alanine-carboxypeptidase/D-alanyl-D-alanine-endopeptidase